MKKKISVAIVTCFIFIYGVYIFLGLCFCEDFSEYAIIGSFIYFGILILNFYCLHWKNNFIAEFIIEKKLNFLFQSFYYLIKIRFYRLRFILHCSVLSGCCNFCNNHFLIQLADLLFIIFQVESGLYPKMLLELIYNLLSPSPCNKLVALLK